VCFYFCSAIQLLDVLKVQAFSAVAPHYNSDAITPFHSPEDVVRRQLDAFQKSDMETAFQCGSQEHQVVCGPTSQDFKELLMSEPAFATLIGHTKSTVLMTTNCADGGRVDGKCVYVRIVPSSKLSKHSLAKRSCLEYWFELSKETTTTTTTTKDDETEGWVGDCQKLTHLGKEDNNETEDEGCWMIDSILPDFEDLSLVSFEVDDETAGEDGEEQGEGDGIYYVNNVNNVADDDDHQQEQNGDAVDEISNIIIQNMIQLAEVINDDDDDCETEFE